MPFIAQKKQEETAAQCCLESQPTPNSSSSRTLLFFQALQVNAMPATNESDSSFAKQPENDMAKHTTNNRA